ncbi:MAG: ArsR/SmtB family transcription factor [Longimicrobiales bacterium]
MTKAEPATLAWLSEPERAAVLLDGERLGLVEALRDRPDSASGLARRLGETRQRLNYHLRALEGAGIVELAEERRRGNLTERVLRVVAQRFVLDPGALGSLAPEPAAEGDRFSATYLVALAVRAIRELAQLMENARNQRKRLATASLDTEVRLLRPADFPAFIAELSRGVAEVVAKYDDDRAGARSFRVILGAYPGAARRGDSRPEARNE